MATVIIPAHNEEVVIVSTLTELLSDGAAESVDVIVVCNGCTDRTVDFAEGFAPRVEVIELDEASKTAAINAGELAAASYPHIVMDADVEMSGSSIATLVGVLDAGALAAEPAPEFETEHSSYPVRAFYRTWLALHGDRPGDIGPGVYALSEAGRKRFGPFPSVIGDDAYVRAHFAPEEIVVAGDARSRVRAPRTVTGLVRVKSRSRLGQLELARDFPGLWTRKRSSTASMRTKIRALPLRRWVDLPLYVVLAAWVRTRARVMFGSLDEYTWERDER